MLENGSDVCNCKKKKCVRHGICTECMNYHNNSARLSLPYCKRPKKSKIQRMLGRSKKDIN